MYTAILPMAPRIYSACWQSKAGPVLFHLHPGSARWQWRGNRSPQHSSKGEQMDIVFITCAAVLVLAFADSWLRQES